MYNLQGTSSYYILLLLMQNYVYAKYRQISPLNAPRLYPGDCSSLSPEKTYYLNGLELFQSIYLSICVSMELSYDDVYSMVENGIHSNDSVMITSRVMNIFAVCLQHGLIMDCPAVSTFTIKISNSNSKAVGTDNMIAGEMSNLTLPMHLAYELYKCRPGISAMHGNTLISLPGGPTADNSYRYSCPLHGDISIVGRVGSGESRVFPCAVEISVPRNVSQSLLECGRKCTGIGGNGNGKIEVVEIEECVVSIQYSRVNMIAMNYTSTKSQNASSWGVQEYYAPSTPSEMGRAMGELYTHTEELLYAEYNRFLTQHNIQIILCTFAAPQIAYPSTSRSASLECSMPYGNPENSDSLSLEERVLISVCSNLNIVVIPVSEGELITVCRTILSPIRICTGIDLLKSSSNSSSSIYVCTSDLCMYVYPRSAAYKEQEPGGVDEDVWILQCKHQSRVETPEKYPMMAGSTVGMPVVIVVCQYTPALVHAVVDRMMRCYSRLRYCLPHLMGSSFSPSKSPVYSTAAVAQTRACKSPMCLGGGLVEIYTYVCIGQVIQYCNSFVVCDETDTLLSLTHIPGVGLSSYISEKCAPRMGMLHPGMIPVLKICQEVLLETIMTLYSAHMDKRECMQNIHNCIENIRRIQANSGDLYVWDMLRGLSHSRILLELPALVPNLNTLYTPSTLSQEGDIYTMFYKHSWDVSYIKQQVIKGSVKYIRDLIGAHT